MGEFADFTDDFHRFMERCMDRKKLRGQDRATVQRELRECVNAWKRVREQEGPAEVDEEALAREFF